MDTQQLNAFLAVADLGSFSRAAQSLHITQPAVSKRIGLLEEQLQARLFDRIGRRITLTEAGRALLPHAREISASLRTAIQSVKDLEGETSGELRIATSHHIGLHRLPPVLERMNQQAPKVKLVIEFMDSEQAYQATLCGAVEIAVVTLAPQEDERLITREIWPDPLDVMVHKNHPLASQESVTIPQLSNYAAVLPGLNTYTGQIVLQLFEGENQALNTAMTTNYLETLRMLATAGLGWTVLPRSMLTDSLCSLSVAGISLERSLGVIYHQSRSLSRAAEAFLQTLN